MAVRAAGRKFSGNIGQARESARAPLALLRLPVFPAGGRDRARLVGMGVRRRVLRFERQAGTKMRRRDRAQGAGARQGRDFAARVPPWSCVIDAEAVLC